MSVVCLSLIHRNQSLNKFAQKGRGKEIHKLLSNCYEKKKKIKEKWRKKLLFYLKRIGNNIGRMKKGERNFS